MMLRKMIVSGVALVGLTGLANAADLAFKAPPPVYIPTWTGCYIGGHAGYGMANSTSQYSAIEQIELGLSGEYNESYNNKGFVGGGQVGCQYQTGTFLWGLEGDWSSFSNSSSYNHAGSFSEIEEEFTASASINQSLSYSSLWSVRGRFGIIASDVFHFYGTAGIGGAKANYTSSASFNESGLEPSSGDHVSLNSVDVIRVRASYL